MKYVALLRGINVGGNNKVSMTDLKIALHDAGLANVTTYINSGNVLFDTDITDKYQIINLIEKTIKQTFGFDINVIVLGKKEFLAVVASIPELFTNDATMKCDVMFLWQKFDSPEVISMLPTKDRIDTVLYTPGAVIWSIDRENVKKSGMAKIIGTPVYKKMTVRNCNTVRKISTLLVAQ